LYRIGFFLEQTLGHITHSQNLQTCIADDPTVDAYLGLLPYETTGISARIPVYRSNWTIRSGMLARRALQSAARQGAFDALFFHTQVPGVLASDWMKGIPAVVSLDATPRQMDQLGAFYAHQTGPEWLEHMKWRLNRACFQNARAIVTWSEWAKKGLEDEYGVAPEKVTVIPPGSDTQSWISGEPRHESNGTVKILFVGGNLERKGGLVLLEAFRILRQRSALNMDGQERIPPVELHLVTRDAVHDEAGLFVYRDLQPNSHILKELYWKSDIFCLPTFGDCLPMVLSEAGAAGLPIISTNLAAIPEVVLDGENGFLVKAGDVQTLVSTLVRLITDPELRLKQGAAGQQIIRQKFDSRKNGARLLNLLKQVADEKRERVKKI
jgi:glycosyltransferase involved in cell wall biosynthesis